MFEKFYELDQAEIVALVKEYLSRTLLATNPELQSEISVAISGSVALGYYDAHSDIDLDFYCDEPGQVDKFKDKIAAFKLAVDSDKSSPLQVHRLKDLETKKNELSGWTRDHALRELSRSLLVTDPNGKLANLQQQFDRYPDDILHEKVQWLFAQLIFEYEERFKISAERSDDYFSAVVKLNIVRLAGNLLLITNKQWISFDKHLIVTLKKSGCEQHIVDLICRAVRTTDNADIVLLVNSLEAYLVSENFIDKKSVQYWVKLRPRHSVEIS